MNLQLLSIMWEVWTIFVLHVEHLCSKDEKHIGKLTQSDTVTFSGCCGNGDIKLPPIKKPSSFTEGMLTGNTPRNKKFHENIRANNSSLAFASLCLTGQSSSLKIQDPTATE